MPESTVQCQTCGKHFQGKRSTARFCGATCRKQAHRAKPSSREASLDSMTERILADMDLDRESARKVVDEVLAEFRFLLPKKVPQYIETYLDGIGATLSERMRLFLAEQKQEAKLELNRAKGEAEELRSRLFDKEIDLDNIRKHNKGLHTRIKNLGLQNAGEGIEPADWDALNAFDDQQLRQWVMVGRRRSAKGDEQAASEAIRWVTGNRVPTAALGDGQ